MWKGEGMTQTQIAESLNLKSVEVDGHTLWWSEGMPAFGQSITQCSTMDT